MEKAFRGIDRGPTTGGGVGKSAKKTGRGHRGNGDEVSQCHSRNGKWPKEEWRKKWGKGRTAGGQGIGVPKDGESQQKKAANAPEMGALKPKTH
jgi:hypothetical protein